MTGSIYIITCTETHKVYIGQTRDTLDFRFRNHLYAAKAGRNKSLIYRAIRKYGEAAFHISLLEELPDCTIDQLNEREIYWIAQYQANNRSYGYNLTEGGGGCSGLDARLDVISVIFGEVTHCGQKSKNLKEQKSRSNSGLILQTKNTKKDVRIFLYLKKDDLEID